MRSTASAPNARRRQLDGQREPVQAPADVGHGPGVPVGQDEGGKAGGGPVDEQPHRVVAQELGGGVHGGLGGRRGAERGHRPHGLAPAAERLAAGRHHPHVGAVSGDGVHQLGAGLGQVLAVVQQQQQAERPQGVRERGGLPGGPVKVDAEGRRDSLRDRAGSSRGASSTNHAPSRIRGTWRRAASTARRVLPTPPAPVRVRIWRCWRRRHTSAISCSRPTKGSGNRGRPVPRSHTPARSATAACRSFRASAGSSSASARSSTVPSRGLCSPRSSPFRVRTLSPARSANAVLREPARLAVLPEQRPEGLLPRSRHGSRLRSLRLPRLGGMLIGQACAPAAAFCAPVAARVLSLPYAGARNWARALDGATEPAYLRPGRAGSGSASCGGAELPTNCVFCVFAAHPGCALRVARRGVGYGGKLPQIACAPPSLWAGRPPDCTARCTPGC